MTNKQKIEMYLDWVNNFLTIECFAEYYEIEEDTARAIINEGREIHNNNTNKD